MYVITRTCFGDDGITNLNVTGAAGALDAYDNECRTGNTGTKDNYLKVPAFQLAMGFWNCSKNRHKMLHASQEKDDAS